MCDAMGMTNSVVAGASGGGKPAEMPGQLPPVKGGGGSMADLLPQIEGIMAALKSLVDKIGGGAAAAVAGASGDAEGGGPVKDAKSGATDVPTQKLPTQVAGDAGPGQRPVQLAPTKVAGDSGPGQAAPTTAGGGKVEQTGVGGAHGHGRGKGHSKGRGKGHAKHMHPGQTPGQVAAATGTPAQAPVKAPAKVEAPVTQVAGDTGQGKDAPAKPVEAPVTQVAGDSGSGKVEAPVTQVAGDSGSGKVDAPAKVEAPVTQVAGDSGSGKDDVPAKVEAPVTQVAGDSGSGKVDVPAKVEVPVTQVAGDSGSEPAKAEPVQTAPVTQAAPTSPVQQAPIVGDVKLLEIDGLNVMQLMAEDGSYLYFNENTVSYRSRTGLIREATVPATGFSVALSDGTKFSYGLHDVNQSEEAVGTPRDLEILSSDGQLLAARTDDGDDASWTGTPLTTYNLLEVASMLFDGSYAKFGSGGEVVQQSDKVVQQSA